jgi:hypothetical protein
MQKKAEKKEYTNLDNKNMKVSVNGGKQTSALQYLSVKIPRDHKLAPQRESEPFAMHLMPWTEGCM